MHVCMCACMYVCMCVCVCVCVCDFVKEPHLPFSEQFFHLYPFLFTLCSFCLYVVSFDFKDCFDFIQCLMLIVFVFQTVVVQTGLSRPPSYLWLSCLVYWCCNCLFGGIAFALSSKTVWYPALFFGIIALYQITVVYGGRHFDRCSVSPEMFVWLHMIDPVTVD